MPRRGSPVEGSVGPVIVVRPLSGSELHLQIDVDGVGQQPVELLLARSVRSLDPSVELRGSWSDGGLADALILHTPREESLELMVPVGLHGVNPEREPGDDGVDKVDGALLLVAPVDLQGPGEGGIILAPLRLLLRFRASPEKGVASGEGRS